MSRGFGSLVAAEWVKLRTVRGWVLALLAGAAAMVALGAMPGMQGSCGPSGSATACTPPTGPDGGLVTDSFSFAHQTMTGDGSLTARVSDLTGHIPERPPADDPGGRPGTRVGVVPWSKAGLILRASDTPGSAYVAIVVTGGHGVRMQYDFTGDLAGPAGAAADPRWLRLTRSGDRVTGEASTDGRSWTRVGTVPLTGAPASVQGGLFVTSPQYAEEVSGPLGANGAMGGPTTATATFDDVTRGGSGWAGGDWSQDVIGAPGGPAAPRVGFAPAAGGLTITGSGDIAPAVSGAAGLGTTITQTLVGTFVCLIAAVVIGAMFVTGEYRRGLIRTTLAAAPWRPGVLAAKALVVGAATAAVGLVAAAVVVPVGQRVLRANGVYVFPADGWTQLRLVLGTALLLGVAAVLGLAVGALLRRGAAAVTTVVAVVVLPYILSVSVLPGAAAQWVLRFSPAAAFAVQQSLPRYPQVDNLYLPADGYFPLAPWAGFAVLAVWAAVALAVAVVLLRRRDA